MRRAATSMLAASALVLAVVGVVAATVDWDTSDDPRALRRPATAATATPPPATTTTATTATTVARGPHDTSASLCLGDSILLAAQLRHFASVCEIVDAKSGRTLAEGVAAAAVSGADAGGTVVVHLGTNRWTQPAEVDALLARLPEAQRILIVNVQVHATRGWEAPTNDLLAGAAASCGRCALVDWKGWSAAHPEWFQPDGIHPTDAGLQAYTALIEGSL